VLVVSSTTILKVIWSSCASRRCRRRAFGREELPQSLGTTAILYKRPVDHLDGAELELSCPCGYENFERVVVQRKPNLPVVTDFVACVGARRCTLRPSGQQVRPNGDRGTTCKRSVAHRQTVAQR